MCPKCGKMKDYNKKLLTSSANYYKHTGYDNNYKINLAISFYIKLVDWHVLN
jgi:hypothetical protein